MGFIPDIELIIKLLPFTRQTLFFSATMPPEIQHLADLFLSNPVRIEVAKPATTAKTVTQLFVHTGRESADKRVVLRELIRGATDLKNAIIFCNRKREVAVLARSLEKHGFSVGALHGDMDQRARMATLDAFKNNRLTLLVASDVAARGLDIPDVSHVYNFDIPTHADDYVHRIGRTGRAGRSGTSITLVAPADQKYLAAIDKLTGDGVKWLDVASTPSTPQAEEAEPSERKRASRRRGAASERSGSEPERSSARAPEAAPAPKPAAKAPAADRKSEGPVTAGRAETRPRPERPAGRPSRHERDDEPVIGLGDHVPQFLLRPVRAPSS
jgi:superfamily II DNA/RNA helicase